MFIVALLIISRMEKVQIHVNHEMVNTCSEFSQVAVMRQKETSSVKRKKVLCHASTWRTELEKRFSAPEKPVRKATLCLIS